MNTKKSKSRIERLETRQLLAATESVDYSFGNEGFTAVPAQYLVASLPDGKYLAVGVAESDRNGAVIPNISRLDSDGGLDPTFGKNGQTSIPELTDHGFGILSGQNVFVCTVNSKHVVDIFSINLDGTLDQDFGTGGIARLPAPPVVAGDQVDSIDPTSIAAEPDGSVVIGFTYEEAPTGSNVALVGTITAAVAKVNANGQLDTSFGSHGFIALGSQPVSGENLYSPSVLIDHQGRINAIQGQGTDFEVYRFHSDGTSDGSFGHGGRVSVNDFPGLEVISNVAGVVQSDDKLLLTGDVNPGSEKDYGAILRLNTDGKLDTTYGDNGFTLDKDLLFSVGGFNLMDIDSQNRLVALNHDTIVRFTSDGSRDNSFGDEGSVNFEAAVEQVTGGAEGQLLNSVSIDPAGWIICGISDDDKNPRLADNDAVFRFAPVPPAVIDTQGTLSIHAGDDSDVVGISAKSKTLKANVNGQVVEFPLSQVKRIDVDLYGGNSAVSVWVNIDTNVEVDIAHVSAGGGTGIDSIQTAGGNDYINTYRNGDVSINSGAGNDYIAANDGTDSINGGSGNDTIEANNSDAATIYGGDGNDSINGTASNDFIYGGGGGDTIHAGLGDDYISGGGGKDHIFGQDGNDTIYGGEGDDAIDGGPGNDLISGQAGNDKLFAADGDADSVYGGSGTDAAVTDAALDIVSSVETIGV